MIVAVDFDNTLAMGNHQYISMLEPNRLLITRLNALRKDARPVIIIVTARGAKNGLTDDQKRRKYLGQITAWLKKYDVPFDQISFNKEYANVYIDDQSILPDADFIGQVSPFTSNKVILTEKTAIKSAKTAPMEAAWYKEARIRGFNVPEVLFVNDECIITEKIDTSKSPFGRHFISIIHQLRNIPREYDYQTYLDNIPAQTDGATPKTIEVVAELANMAHPGTFFHGDLSTTNVLIRGYDAYLIDPNFKHIFGSYLTDAGKAAFSLIAYEAQFPEAKKIADEFGNEVWYYAVSEGLRVCKYAPKYISIVNNIADLI